MYQLSPQPKKKRIGLWITLGVVGLFVVSCTTIFATGFHDVVPTTTPAVTTQAVVHVPTIVATKPTTPTPQPTHYPPKTLADVRGLAAMGDASAIHEFKSESVGAVGVCPESKREVTVDPRVTGKQLAEDLLAYFYMQQLDNPCGSIVFAYHSQAEANDVYTAGRVDWTVTDANGGANFNPNASNLKHALTLDIGGDLTHYQEYVVTY